MTSLQPPARRIVTRDYPLVYQLSLDIKHQDFNTILLQLSSKRGGTRRNSVMRFQHDRNAVVLLVLEREFKSCVKLNFIHF